MRQPTKEAYLVRAVPMSHICAIIDSRLRVLRSCRVVFRRSANSGASLEQPICQTSLTSLGESITVAQRDALVARLRTAWNNLPPTTRAQLKPILDEGHDQFVDFVATGKPPSHDFHAVLRIKSFTDTCVPDRMKSNCIPGRSAFIF